MRSPFLPWKSFHNQTGIHPVTAVCTLNLRLPLRPSPRCARRPVHRRLDADSCRTRTCAGVTKAGDKVKGPGCPCWLCFSVGFYPRVDVASSEWLFVITLSTCACRAAGTVAGPGTFCERSGEVKARWRAPDSFFSRSFSRSKCHFCFLK